MNQQLFGLNINKSLEGWLPREEGSKPGMLGFVADYVTAKCSNKKIAARLMQTYSPSNLSVLSGIAKAYAVSDNYHASTPTQTWPNRGFMHAATSEGKVNNFPFKPYSSKTIFNVFEDAGESWRVYKSSKIIPSLTRIQMTQLWDLKLNDHFLTVEQFIDDCENSNLPAYSFVEPSFILEKGITATSEHPPADVCAGEYFIQKIYNAVVKSPAFDRILFIINFDEHGGCPDHVPPNWTALAPDDKSSPGQLGFHFDRYGVRVPAIFISPHIAASSCIRAHADPWNWEKPQQPFDHTSILAMLLDWKNIDRTKLPSKRLQSAPKNPFDDLLGSELRTDRPEFFANCTIIKLGFFKRMLNMIKNLLGICAEGYSISSLQKSIIVADAHYRKAHVHGYVEGTFADQDEIDDLMRSIRSDAHLMSHFKSLYPD